jgi:SpoVK/Ycf46/Vps4 family AAA+-type ATPase
MTLISLNILSAGRFDRLLYVGPPNEIDREEIFSIHLRKTPYDSDVSMNELAQLTDGYTGADIAHICRQAALAALEVSHSA